MEPTQPQAFSTSWREELPGNFLVGDAFKVAEVVRHPNKTFRFQGNYVFDESGLKTESPVQCAWEILPEAVGLQVKGQLHGSLVLECFRCLEPYIVPIDLNLDEHYVFSQYVETEQTASEKELHADDFFEVVSQEGELDLKDLVHQFLVLEVDNLGACNRPECHFVEPLEEYSSEGPSM